MSRNSARLGDIETKQTVGGRLREDPQEKLERQRERDRGRILLRRKRGRRGKEKLEQGRAGTECFRLVSRCNALFLIGHSCCGIHDRV